MKICVAQIKCIKGNISENIMKHERLITLAVSHHADAIFFSELSISGYEPTLAGELATSDTDPRFKKFQFLSDQNKLTIGVGAPINSDKGVLISMIIFRPLETPKIYSKQQLHDDELPYFTPGDKQLIFDISGLKIAPAICYESLQTSHAEKACEMGAKIYLASVAKPHEGMKKAQDHYSHIAKKHQIPVLMSNCIGSCDNFEGAGISSIWDSQGSLVNQLDSTREGLLIFNTETQEASQLTI